MNLRTNHLDQLLINKGIWNGYTVINEGLDLDSLKKILAGIAISGAIMLTPGVGTAGEQIVPQPDGSKVSVNISGDKIVVKRIGNIKPNDTKMQDIQMARANLLANTIKQSGVINFKAPTEVEAPKELSKEKAKAPTLKELPKEVPPLKQIKEPTKLAKETISNRITKVLTEADNKYISIKRIVNGDASASTLVMEDGKLRVMGNLPHGAEISFDGANAEKLINWLKTNKG
jgi:hypothetical protein